MKPQTQTCRKNCGSMGVSTWKILYSVAVLGGCLLPCPVVAMQPSMAFQGPQQPRAVKRILSKVSRPIRNILWPNTAPDLAYSEPLPPGPLGCPFRGLNPRESSADFGPGVLFFRLYQKLQRPKVFKFFSNNNRGIAIVSGYATSKAVLSQEFDTITSQMVPFTSKVVGTHSLRCVQDKKEHATLRKLIDMAVQPANVHRLIPSIQQTAETLIDKPLVPVSSSSSSSTISHPAATTIDVEDLCLKYTMEIACRHIIGLQDLPDDEVDYFLSQVKTWISAVYTAPSKNDDAENSWVQARNYLVGKIEDKLSILEKNGPDQSTVSGMYFAKDPDDPNGRRLSKDEIIDNTLLLIFAGSETSAGTLTNCLLMLGLDKLAKRPTTTNMTAMTAWQELVQEQQRIMKQRGNSSSSSSLSSGTTVLDREALEMCTYLDGVVRESLRIKPVVGGSMRGTKSTIVVDGYQIPAGWGVTYDRYNTHLSDPVTFQEDFSHMNVIRGFDPTRWQGLSPASPDGMKNSSDQRRPGQEWIPFGIGPRYCLGYDLAMVEMKIFLAVLARKMLDFEMVSPVVQDLEWASDIRWKEKVIIPVPIDGVILRPIPKKVARKHQEWTFERIYKINQRLGCAD